MVVAGERDGLDLHLGLAVHLESHPDGILDYGVVFLKDIHLRVYKSLLLIVILDYPYGRAEHVVRQRDSAAQAQTVLQFRLLGVLYTLEVPPGDPGPLLQVQGQEHGVSSG